MAFDIAILPNIPNIFGITKTYIDPVIVTGNGTREVRYKTQLWERLQWTIPAQSMTEDQRLAFREFFVERNHGLNSFLFQDPHTPTATNYQLEYSSGSNWKYTAPYSNGTASTHPLWYAEPFETTVTLDGIVNNFWMYDVVDGYPIINVPGSNSGSDVQITGPILYQVRLDSSFNHAIVALDACNQSNIPIGHNVGEIKLVEVFNE